MSDLLGLAVGQPFNRCELPLSYGTQCSCLVGLAVTCNQAVYGTPLCSRQEVKSPYNFLHTEHTFFLQLQKNRTKTAFYQYFIHHLSACQVPCAAHGL